MPRSDASPEALTLARACIHLQPRGPRYTDIVYVPPGGDWTNDAYYVGTENNDAPDTIAERAEWFAGLLAMFGEVCLSRGRAERYGVLSLRTPDPQPPTPAECLTSEVCVEAELQAREDALRPDEGE